MSLPLLLLLLLLLALSAFFSGAETAMTSVSRTWLQSQAKKGDRRAALAAGFLKDSERLLGTILIGNNLVNISLTNLANLLVSALLASYISRGILSENWEEWITSLVLTPVVLVFGEAVPKALGRNHSGAFALLAARPLGFLEVLLRPFVALTCWTTRALSPRQEEESAAPGVTREDMKMMAEMAAEQGLVNKEAGEMLQSVLELDKRPVETAMVPLVEVRSLSETSTVGDALRLAGASGFLHLPVYRERVDRIIGVVNARDLLSLRTPGEAEDEFLKQPLVPFVTKKLLFVPESQPVNVTLEHLRRASLTMAIVVDEYGGMTGMVTVQDLVELIVGNLNDRREGEFFRVQWIAPGVFLCNGRMETGTLEEYLGFSLPRGGYETAAGFVLKLAGRIPAAGEKFQYRNMEITVLHVEEHRITRLKFQCHPSGRRPAKAAEEKQGRKPS
ncbi:MAG: hemolysin family protein [Oligosphaeraceae bacterium]